jgi:hypothetical protein
MPKFDNLFLSRSEPDQWYEVVFKGGLGADLATTFRGADVGMALHYDPSGPAAEENRVPAVQSKKLSLVNYCEEPISLWVRVFLLNTQGDDAQVRLSIAKKTDSTFAQFDGEVASLRSLLGEYSLGSSDGCRWRVDELGKRLPVKDEHYSLCDSGEGVEEKVVTSFYEPPEDQRDPVPQCRYDTLKFTVTTYSLLKEESSKSTYSMLSSQEKDVIIEAKSADASDMISRLFCLPPSGNRWVPNQPQVAACESSDSQGGAWYVPLTISHSNQTSSHSTHRDIIIQHCDNVT